MKSNRLITLSIIVQALFAVVVLFTAPELNGHVRLALQELGAEPVDAGAASKMAKTNSNVAKIDPSVKNAEAIVNHLQTIRILYKNGVFWMLLVNFLTMGILSLALYKTMKRT